MKITTYKDACDILGIPVTATPAEAKTAFKRLSMVCHPDKGGTNDLFCYIKEAYDFIAKHHTSGTQSADPAMNNRNSDTSRRNNNYTNPNTGRQNSQHDWSQDWTKNSRPKNSWHDIIQRHDFIVPIEFMEEVLRKNQPMPITYKGFSLNISPSDLQTYAIKGQGVGEILITTYANPLLRLLHLFPKNKNIAKCKAHNDPNHTCSFRCRLICDLPKGYHTVTIRFGQNRVTFNAETVELNSATIVKRTMRFVKNLTIEFAVEMKASFN